MIRSAFDFTFGKVAALAAFGLALGLSPLAQASELQHARHHHAARHVAHYVAPAGDIVVHTGDTSYNQDPYTSFLAGPRYYSDTALDTDPGLVYPFGHFGQSVLPSRFSPPGQDEPLFRF